MQAADSKGFLLQLERAGHQRPLPMLKSRAWETGPLGASRDRRPIARTASKFQTASRRP
jgi:hypothetical protein